MNKVAIRQVESPGRLALLGLIDRTGAAFFEGWSDAGRVTIALPLASEVVELGWDEIDRSDDFLRHILSGSGRGRPNGLPFAGGWAGFLSYEAGAAWERAAPPGDVPDEPAAWFARHESGIILQTDGSAWAFGPGEDQLDEIETLVRNAREAGGSLERDGGTIEDSLGAGAYPSAVDDIRERIARGDVYQVNLTRRFVSPVDVEPVLLYVAMTGEEPPRCSALLRGDDWAIASASPEVFLRFDPENGTADSRPIKGTLRRTGDDAADASTLLASAKDEAEHLMIVDLVRNDLGKVAPPGRVRVAEYKGVRTLEHVLHLESTVEASGLAPGDLPALVRALFPGGSITGAPKRAAVHAIRELEPCARGVYTGAIGFVDDSGFAELSVAIRTAVIGTGRCRYHAGGGIVWDSDPRDEDRESFAKSIAFLEALGGWTTT